MNLPNTKKIGTTMFACVSIGMTATPMKAPEPAGQRDVFALASGSGRRWTLPDKTGFGPGYYLCGCNIQLKRGYIHDIDDKGHSVMTRTDKAGFNICPEHGEREYGWRSPRVVGPQGNAVPDWSAMGSRSEVRLKESTMPDLRPQAPQRLLGGKSLKEMADNELETRGIYYDIATGADGVRDGDQTVVE